MPNLVVIKDNFMGPMDKSSAGWLKDQRWTQHSHDLSKMIEEHFERREFEQDVISRYTINKDIEKQGNIGIQ